MLLHLGLPTPSKVIYVRSPRLGGQQPLVIANTWLPAALFPGFLKQDLEKASVYDIMRALVTAQSISRVLTPGESALENPARVFSGARPRAPR